MRKAQTMVVLLSFGLMIAGVVILVKVPYFYARSHIEGQNLIKAASPKVTVQSMHYHSVSNIRQPKSGSLIGVIHIPSIALLAPIVQGTKEGILNHGAGHLDTSVMPGEVGTSVIAAHNATWFRHINELKPGNVIEVETNYGKFRFQVTKSTVVRTGDPVYNTSDASLVLEACYPLNALYLTPYRFLVYAQMDSTGKWEPTQKKLTYVTYHVNIPSRLVNEDLTLSTNALPMGTLSYTGSPSKTYTESESPLSASNALVQLYLGWLHAASHNDLGDLKSMAPNAATNPFIGVPLSNIRYSSLFDVTLDVNHDSLRTVTAVIQPYVSGGGHYKVTITGKVDGTTISIESLLVQKGS